MTTRHVRDRRGRVVRSVTTSEPRWTEQDRAEVLAWRAYQDRLCPLCGGPREVCTSHEETGPQFKAAVSAVCRVTLAKLELYRGMTDDGKKSLPNERAYLWSVTESR